MNRWSLQIMFAATLLLPSALQAQSDGGTQSPFVLGSGAREQAMGRAAVALSKNSEALFWNPARLTSVLHPELSLYRSQLFVDGSTYHTAFMAYPTLDFGVFSVGYQRVAVSGIERRDARNQLLGDFGNSESNLLLGYGRQFGSLISAGAALRIAQQSIDNYSDAAFGLDLGVALQKPLDKKERHRVSLGANIQNAIEPKLRLLNEDVEDPRHLRLGVGYEGAHSTELYAWAAGVDLVFSRKSDWTGGIGSEFTYARALSLRMGLDGSNPTFGLGVQWRQVRFDYALRTDDTLPRNDRFTLAVHFGTSVQQRRQKRRQAQNQQVTDQLAQLLQEREAQELQRALTAAEAAFNAEQWQEALRLYRRVLALDPTHQRAQQQRVTLAINLPLLQAKGLMVSGQAAQAAGLYQTILNEWPSEERAQQGLDEAHASLQESADRDAALRDLFKEALDQYMGDNYLSAQVTLNELLRLDPQFELAFDLQERIAQEIRGQGDVALREAQQLAKKNHYKAALRKLAEARKSLGATARLDALESQWQGEDLASQRRTQELAAQDTSPESINGTEDTTPLTPRNLTPEQRRDLQSKYQKGLAAFTSGNFDAATRLWRAVWVEDPNLENVSSYLIKAYLFQGVELYGRGKYDDALERCKRVLEIDPTNEKALRYLDRIEEEKLEIEAIERGKSDE